VCPGTNASVAGRDGVARGIMTFAMPQKAAVSTSPGAYDVYG
jgi:hypothetical protein